MKFNLFPLRYFLAGAALCLNRRQQAAIDYLLEENRLLREKLGDRRISFSESERRRRGIRAKAAGRKLPGALNTMVTPDTLPR